MKRKSLPDLKNKIVNGMITLIIRDLGMKIIGILGQIILVRLIAPEFFGIFAILSFCSGVAELFTDLGLSQSIVQSKQKLTQKQIDSIITVKFFVSIVISILLILSFPIIKMVYKQLDNSHILLLAAFSISIWIKSVKNSLMALLDKDLNFKAVSRIDTIGVIVYFLVAITLALLKYYLWGLVLAIVIKELIEFTITAYYKRWVPKISIDLKIISDFLKFGFYIQIGNIISFLNRSTIPIAGYNLTAVNLGYLNWSRGVANLSNTLFDNYGRAAFAGMSKIQNNDELLTIAVTKSVKALNIVSFLFILLVLGFSHEFTFLVLSARWLPAVNILYLFSLSLYFYGASVSISHALLAKGKSKEVVSISGVLVLIDLILAFLFVRIFGFTGIAIASCLGSISLFTGYFILSKNLGLKINISSLFLRNSIVFLMTASLIYLLNVILPGYLFITLIVKITLSIVAYLSFTKFVSPVEFLQLKRMMRL